MLRTAEAAAEAPEVPRRAHHKAKQEEQKQGELTAQQHNKQRRYSKRKWGSALCP